MGKGGSEQENVDFGLQSRDALHGANFDLFFRFIRKVHGEHLMDMLIALEMDIIYLICKEPVPRDAVLGTLVRFKQLKNCYLVSEILEWLRMQHWWDFIQMDFLMIATAYGKFSDFSKAGRVLKYMSKNGYWPTVISQTTLMKAYGKAKHYLKAEAVIHKMQTSSPEPSPITHQIIPKSLV
ncbi:hypothetical protein ACQ4PT_053855 [Festuca glaucescens]